MRAAREPGKPVFHRFHRQVWDRSPLDRRPDPSVPVPLCGDGTRAENADLRDGCDYWYVFRCSADRPARRAAAPRHEPRRARVDRPGPARRRRSRRRRRRRSASVRCSCGRAGSTSRELARALAHQYGLEYVDLETAYLDPRDAALPDPEVGQRSRRAALRGRGRARPAGLERSSGRAGLARSRGGRLEPPNG